jgi:hypothetical protein
MSSARSFTALVMILALPGSLACSGSARQRPVKMGAVDTGPNSLTAARKYLEGRWSLLSFDVYPPGGQPIGLKGSGTLTYDEFGNLKIEIRTDDETSDLLRKAGVAIEGGVISSEGRVVVDLAAQKLTYVIEGQPPAGAPAGPLATSRPRYWQVDGNVLTLTTKDDNGKPLSVGRWRKLE